jgi:hypothetical protein
LNFIGLRFGGQVAEDILTNLKLAVTEIESFLGYGEDLQCKYDHIILLKFFVLRGKAWAGRMTTFLKISRCRMTRHEAKVCMAWKFRRQPWLLTRAAF